MALDTVFRTQAVFPSISARPEDTVTNTWHFLVDGSLNPISTAGDIHAALGDFYNSGTTSISSYMSSTLVRSGSSSFFKTYDLSEPEPRVPVTQQYTTLDAPTQSNMLPFEIAAVLSFQATPASGEPQARKRGRLYIGPLATNALTGTDGTLASAFLGVIRARATILRAAGSSSTFRWAVYSRTANTAGVVDGGWTDNACDIQRRRGQIATTRTTWT